MRLDIRFSGTKQNGNLNGKLEAILLDSLERFQRRVRHVCVFIEDVNGPKGGIDKQCRCVVHLRKMPPIVIQDEDTDLVALVHRIANRASYTLSEKTKRSSFKGMRRRFINDTMAKLCGDNPALQAQDLAVGN